MYAMIQTYETTIQILAVILLLLVVATTHFWMEYRRARRREQRLHREILDLQAELVNEKQRYASARSVLELMHRDRKKK